MAWISPIGHSDPDEKWSSEENAYDDDTATCAVNAFADQGYWLELELSEPIWCDKVRVFSYTLEGETHLNTGLLQIEAFYDDDWHAVFTGEVAKDTWVEKYISDAGEQLVGKVRVQWASGIANAFHLCELDFWQTSEVSYKSPTGHVLSGWADEEYAYDKDVETSSSRNVGSENWSQFLTLKYEGGLLCDKVKFFAYGNSASITEVEVDVSVDDGANWINFRSGVFNYTDWNIWSFDMRKVNQVRFRFYNDAGTTKTAYVIEVYLGEVVSSAPGYKNCIGLWRMNDNAANKTVVDNSGNGNDGTAQQNTDQLHTAGKIGGALTHNGTSDFINIPHHSDFNIQDALSIAAWIRQTANNNGFIVMKDESDGSAAYYGLHSYSTFGANGRLYFFYGRAGDAVDNVLVDAPYPIDDGQYHLVIVIVDYLDVKFYVDGSCVGTAVLDDNMVSADNSVEIGHGNVYDHHFEGDMDIVGIFNKALSDEEIAFLWNEGKGREQLAWPRPLVGGSLAGRRGLI